MFPGCSANTGEPSLVFCFVRIGGDVGFPGAATLQWSRDPQDLGRRSTHITAGWKQWLPVYSYFTTRLEGKALVLYWMQQGPEKLTESGREVKFSD